MSRYEIVNTRSESDLPAGITINPIYYVTVEDTKTGRTEEGSGWSEDEAYDDAVQKLEQYQDDDENENEH